MRHLHRDRSLPSSKPALTPDLTPATLPTSSPMEALLFRLFFALIAGLCVWVGSTLYGYRTLGGDVSPWVVVLLMVVGLLCALTALGDWYLGPRRGIAVQVRSLTPSRATR